ncbi:MAG: anthranilate phosphoribosyltransferase [Actinomycetaceae bacterium]|nr:anthranilate phosphoribosyltransferase [Arcanobacterium sp.]MDD7687142.1 anthranilate phosphoribosyltransferase [Actinomycetaceae bacterium]MDY5273885.1 anthranilate phosphoribosyltransferase [Arcanobacterium sp.]
MIREAIETVVQGNDLDVNAMTTVMNEIMEGDATDAQSSALLTALSMKGETIEEITAAARVMRQHASRFFNDMPVLEIVGTGGDRSNTFNISTIAAIVVSTVGIPVAKHGNRAASSQSGAADLLEACGANIELAPGRSAQILKELNFCFMFAQRYHPSMRFVGNVRKEIGIRTLFNILGPLANPAGAQMQLSGVYSEPMVELYTHVLVNLGVKNAMVVYGQDKMDEISLSAPTTVCEAIAGEFRHYEITPEDFGFKRCEKSDLAGGTPEENVGIALDVLGNKPGPRRDAVIFNAGAGIHIARPEYSIAEGVQLAREAIASGRALAQLEAFVRATQQD